MTFLGSKAIDGEIKPRELSVIDPVGKCTSQSFYHTDSITFLGAIVISLYIIICWIPQVRRKFLVFC